MKNNKNIVIASFGAILLLLGACQQGPKKEEPKESEPRQEKVAPPKGIISLEESKSLYDNYTKNRLDIIEKFEAERNADEKFVPARFTSFTYADMKQYMHYVEQEAKEAGVKVASLRLYFANYPDKPDFPDGEKVVHPRQNSIFIVPTTMMDGEEQGFYIDAEGKAKPIKGVVGTDDADATGETNTAQASFAPSLFQRGSTSLNLNHGTSGPPPYTDF
ncbi:hypothetical protein K1F50_08165 [Muricauda oceani]|uniref:Lipoprotein n=1 Tax=Flagellimonas oceani TaxID=2698672 RepID=A0A6G7J3V1_9FLAO|nr:hypothetical protein [Allomuricauda oceani]MBW8242770.1 hypothetical protein [Allomuricauda oceani]QII45495.1 hypothetical protein GVT53_12660 [Allomuricauda oceani]